MKNVQTVQTTTTVGFIKRHADLNSFYCSRSCGESDTENSLLILPSETTKFNAYEAYANEWQHLVDATAEMNGESHERPQQNLTYTVFWKVWNSNFLLLKIEKKGNYFCDICATLRNAIKFLDGAV